MTRIQKDGYTWEIDPEFAPILESVLAIPGQIIKESPVKLVRACTYQGQTFYIKHYRHAAVVFRPAKYLFKSSQARQEWNLATQLANRKIPIVRHLALGERWSLSGLQESILVTEGFEGIPLMEAGPSHNAQVLDLVHQMHAAGVYQNDLHGSNLLVNTKTGEMRLVDLHGSVVKSSLSEQEKLMNLAICHHFLKLSVPTVAKELGLVISKVSHKKRSHRAWRVNRDFGALSAGGLQWQLRLLALRPDAKSVLHDPEAFLKNGSRLLKNGRSATVGLAPGLVLKRYNFKKPLNLVKDFFRGSRARRAFRKAYHLELAGIPTARPIAYADQTAWGFCKRSYLLMEEIPGAVELSRFQGDWYHMIPKAAALIAHLHNQGFYHRDLKPSNLIVDEEGAIYLIDLEGLEFVNEVSRQRAQADLARLARGVEAIPGFQRSYVSRFLRHYCRIRKLRPSTFLKRS